jgi:hypothetical protein
MRQAFILIFFVICVIVDSAHGAHFRIVITEGENTFDYNLSHSNLMNKYLAMVQLFKDDVLILDGIRGSTLSDSVFYYQLWHDGIEDRSPTDKDIQKIFADWDAQVDANLIDPNFTSFIQDLNKIIRFFVSIPVVWSGKYKFVIGLHKGGNSVHGKPYVPRLKGTWDKDKPYNASSEDNTDDQVKKLNGIWLATINENKAHGMRKVAAGINIHDGRRSKDYRDSEGCLTIHPDDWSAFIHTLPTIEDWKSVGHTGEVIVIRKKPAGPTSKTPSPPQNLHVIEY